MSGRRLPLVGGAPEAPRALIATGHPVIALRGEDAAVTAFAGALLDAVAPPLGMAAVVPVHAGAVLDALRSARALHVLAGSDALAAWLATLAPHMPIVCLGPAADALAPTFSIGLGRARNANAPSSDLWLGYPHERVAKALGHVLTRAR